MLLDRVKLNFGIDVTKYNIEVKKRNQNEEQPVEEVEENEAQ